MDTVPILRDHKSIAAFVSGVVIFGIAAKVRGGLGRAVVIGVLPEHLFYQHYYQFIQV